MDTTDLIEFLKAEQAAEVEIANLWRLSGKAAEELTLLHEVRSKLFELCAQRLREHEAP